MLDALKHTFKSYHRYLLPHEEQYVINLIDYISENSDNQTTKWLPYNIRYGDKSLYGTIGEIIALYLLRKYNTNNEEYYGEFEDRDFQITGADIKINKYNWGRTYTGSVKITRINDDTILVYKKWFTNVDRLIMIDPRTMKLIMSDTNHVINVYKQSQPKEYKHLNIQDILNNKFSKLIYE